VARFSCAIWRPISANTGGALASIGALMHQQVGNGSLYGFFSNPAAQVSAHFWVGKAGAVEQYVDTSVVAWHAKQLNATYVGVECEGYPDEALTPAQVDGFAGIMAEGHGRHGWPLELAEYAPEPGLGYHRMPGGVNTACPSALRVAQRAEILQRAGGQAPPAAQEWRSETMIASTTSGEGYWTVTRDGAVYAFGDAQFAGGAFDLDPDDPGRQPMAPGATIVGIAGCGNDGYWLLGSDGGVFAFGSAQFYGRPDRV
jgi:hypothetical protein